MQQSKLLLVAGATVLVGLSATPALAQSYDRYEYCRDRAAEITGYDGRRPSRYERGNVVEDAIRGSVRGRVVSGILGGNKRQRDRAARRGRNAAVVGGIIRRNVQRDRDNDRRREYRRELDRCMEG